MHTAAAVWQRLIGYDRMQHLVIKNVTQKPERDERLIEQRIDANDAILFLNCAENKIIARSMFASAAPHHLITTKTPAKISLIQIIENSAQIEVFPFMLQIQLALHRQLRVRDFAFCFLGHFLGSPRDWIPAPITILVSFDRLTRKAVRFRRNFYKLIVSNDLRRSPRFTVIPSAVEESR